MRLLLLAALVSLPAFADVGPRPPRCSVPSTCVMCSQGSDIPEDCKNGALDAGLEPAECTDRRGSVLDVYYCPPGTNVARGCAAAPGGAMAVLGVVLTLRRRRSLR